MTTANLQPQALNILKGARALIAKGWTKHTSAKDAQNWYVEVRDPSACQFCAIGAGRRASLDLGIDINLRDSVKSVPALFLAMQTLALAVGVSPLLLEGDDDDSIPGWNDADERTHAEVLAGYDAAIARLEQAS